MSSADLFQDEERLLTGSHKEAQTASDEHVALGYAIYPARWWQLTLFSLLSISNALLWITFAPITTQVQGFYDVSLLWVNRTALCMSMPRAQRAERARRGEFLFLVIAPWPVSDALSSA